VRQQVVKLQQQLADLQSTFDEELRKAIPVILSHHLILALFVSLLLPAGLNLRQHVGQVQGTVWP